MLKLETQRVRQLFMLHLLQVQNIFTITQLQIHFLLKAAPVLCLSSNTVYPDGD